MIRTLRSWIVWSRPVLLNVEKALKSPYLRRRPLHYHLLYRILLVQRNPHRRHHPPPLLLHRVLRSRLILVLSPSHCLFPASSKLGRPSNSSSNRASRRLRRYRHVETSSNQQTGLISPGSRSIRVVHICTSLLSMVSRSGPSRALSRGGGTRAGAYNETIFFFFLWTWCWEPRSIITICMHFIPTFDNHLYYFASSFSSSPIFHRSFDVLVKGSHVCTSTRPHDSVVYKYISISAYHI